MSLSDQLGNKNRLFLGVFRGRKNRDLVRGFVSVILQKIKINNYGRILGFSDSIFCKYCHHK
jgi:hypothetical protein